MIKSATIARKTFNESDQIIFADLSGDYNPLHMDSQASRRLPAGACVVHGIHAMLWALQELSSYASLAALNGLRVCFTQFLYLNESVELRMERLADGEVRAELVVGLIKVAQYSLRFGELINDAAALSQPTAIGVRYGAEALAPLELDWSCAEAMCGTVDRFTADEAASQHFPMLSSVIGAARLGSIISLTRLVGMVAPGLHSTFHSLDLKIVSDAPSADPLVFSVDARSSRHKILIIRVRSSGITGTVTASRRPSSITQLGSAQLRNLVGERRFEQNCALVVGGSRGLGELTAKILGALGVNVIVTYCFSRQGAEAVVSDIRCEGGRAWAIQFDVLSATTPQIVGLDVFPKSVYYFATPRISRRREGTFSRAVFQEFCDFYVDGFQKVAFSTAEAVHAPIRMFYPSTIFIDAPAPNLTEYVAAKAAGEAIAMTINRSAADIHVDVARLPRLPTDQTSGIIMPEFESALRHILPIALEIEAAVAARVEES